MVVRWLVVRQARARHSMEVPPTEPTAVKIWRKAGPALTLHALHPDPYDTNADPKHRFKEGVLFIVDNGIVNY